MRLRSYRTKRYRQEHSRGCWAACARITGALAVVALGASGQVSTYEGRMFPEDDGWDRSTFCTPERLIGGAWLHQHLEVGECIPPPDGDRDSYTRLIEEFNETPEFFLEFRVETNGDRSEMPGGAPTVVALGNDFGIHYNATVSRDLVKLYRDASLPILFIDVQAHIAHTIRVELHNDHPATYRWYIDSQVVDEGEAEGPFPAQNARASWRGKAWYLPCENRWDYFRCGVIPVNGSGDYDTDEDVDSRDFYFFHECLSNRRPGINGGPGDDAGPGCRFADFDSDSDVDLLDYAEFQVNFTGNN